VSGKAHCLLAIGEDQKSKLSGVTSFNLSTTATSPQWQLPLKRVLRVAVVERFDCDWFGFGYSANLKP